jgi:hypothetical protein
MMQESVDERVFVVASRWMHDQSGRLIQHKKVFVFEEHFERHRFGFGFRCSRFRPMNCDDFAGARTVGRFRLFPIDKNLTFLEEALDGAA